jgi:hypothetical protein
LNLNEVHSVHWKFPFSPNKNLSELSPLLLKDKRTRKEQKVMAMLFKWWWVNWASTFIINKSKSLSYTKQTKKIQLKPGMVMQAYNFGTQKTEVRRLQFPGQNGYILNSCLKKKKINSQWIKDLQL